jgi:glyoxylase-like metal-dependent hydrolase (beta-lactamase superfamily II)
MSDTVHQFTMGEFTGTILREGFFRMGPTSTFFEGASPDELEFVFDRYGLQAEGVDLSVTCLLLERGNQRILIDCGAGQRGYRKGLGRLPQSLNEIGLQLTDITHVILTHVHFDHSVGIVTLDDKPTFPNARYFMPRGSWQLWAEDIFKGNPDAENDKYAVATRKALHIIQPQLELFDPELELQGVYIIATPGHTQHHISLHIVSDDNHLIVTSDAIVHPVHIEHLTWHLAWDVDAKQRTQSTKKLLHLAEKHNALMYCCHFDFPCLGHVAHQDGNWKWEAV